MNRKKQTKKPCPDLDTRIRERVRDMMLRATLVAGIVAEKHEVPLMSLALERGLFGTGIDLAVSAAAVAFVVAVTAGWV